MRLSLPIRKGCLAKNVPGAEPVARGLLMLGIGQASFILCGYVFHIYLARILGPTDYGLFGFVLTILVWLEISTYGVRDTAIQYINVSPRFFASLYRSFFRVQALISCVLFLLANLAFAPLALLKTRYDALFLIALLDLPFMGLYQLYLGYLNAFRLYSRQSAGLIVYSITKMVFIILFVQVGWGAAGALLGNVFSSLFALITCSALFLPKRNSELAGGESVADNTDVGVAVPSIKAIVASSLLFIIIPLFYNLMMSMDLWIVSLAVGGEMVGFYVAAGTVAKTVFFLFAIFYMTFFPAIVNALRTGNRTRMSRLLYFSFALFIFTAFPASLLLAVNAKEITQLIYGPAYASASSVISILSLAYFFLSLKVFLVYILYAANYRKQAVSILLGITALSLPFIYFLTRWKNIQGAAFGTAIVCFIGAILSYFAMNKVMRLGWASKKMALSVALALLAYMPLAWVPKNQINFLPLSCLSTVIFFLGLKRLGLLPKRSFVSLYKEIIGGIFR
jgi:O-antigen/teichoic acid export membrane protein